MLPENPKLFALSPLADERRRLRRTGQVLVMTNGCFDLLHPGHVCFLQNARRLGDRLLVALNSDSSVKGLKGPERPVQTELERASALAALDCVDYLVLFTEPNLVGEIVALQPDVYAKADDYDLSKLHPGERAALEACGATIRFLPFLEGFSTTSLLRKKIQAGDTG
jgi:rfaE bifunctional protein nucleotidyltransferase chain/domain